MKQRSSIDFTDASTRRRAIFFDFGGTLLDYSSIACAEHEAIGQFLNKVGLASRNDAFQADFSAALKRAYEKSAAVEYRPSKYIIPEILKVLSLKYGYTHDGHIDEIFFDCWHAMHRRECSLTRNANAVLRYLACRYSELGIISDIDTDLLDGILKELGIASFFQIVVTSENVNACKPSEVIFLRTLDRLAGDRSEYELFYVGDSYERDLLGARAVGMKTILYDRNIDREIDATGTDYLIHDFSEIMDFL